MKTHASKLVPVFLRGLRAAGGDPSPLVRRFALPPDSADSKTIEVSLATEREVLEGAARAAKDPFLGVHIAERLPRGSWGVIEYVASSARTMGEGLRWILDQSPLVSEVAEISLSERRGTVVLEHRIKGDRAGLGCQGNEYVLALIVRIGRDATGQRIAPGRVWFSHRRSGPASGLAEFFGTRKITFGESTNGLTIPARLLTLPFRTSDPTLHEILANDARRKADVHAGNLVSRVRGALKGALDARRPDIDYVATELRMSPRTLQRRLESSGFRFQALLDEARATLGRAYLEDPELALGEIAYRLGYDRLSSFVRAFHRWTGSTPAAWRRSRS